MARGGKFCVVGILYRMAAEYEVSMNGAVFNLAERALQIAVGGDPTQFNDRPDTDRPRVVALLRKAAETVDDLERPCTTTTARSQQHAS